MEVLYNRKQIQVRSGAWCDDMNSCFYEIIDHIKGYMICREFRTQEVFAMVEYKY